MLFCNELRARHSDVRGLTQGPAVHTRLPHSRSELDILLIKMFILLKKNTKDVNMFNSWHDSLSDHPIENAEKQP